jgi:hypothetical protein
VRAYRVQWDWTVAPPLFPSHERVDRHRNLPPAVRHRKAKQHCTHMSGRRRWRHDEGSGLCSKEIVVEFATKGYPNVEGSGAAVQSTRTGTPLPRPATRRRIAFALPFALSSSCRTDRLRGAPLAAEVSTTQRCMPTQCGRIWDSGTAHSAVRCCAA